MGRTGDQIMNGNRAPDWRQPLHLATGVVPWINAFSFFMALVTSIRPRKCGQQGCSLIIDEMEEGLSVVAVPIIDAGGRTIAAMNIALTTGAVKRQELLNTVLPELRQAAARLNSILSLNAG